MDSEIDDNEFHALLVQNPRPLVERHLDRVRRTLETVFADKGDWEGRYRDFVDRLSDSYPDFFPPPYIARSTPTKGLEAFLHLDPLQMAADLANEPVTANRLKAYVELQRSWGETDLPYDDQLAVAQPDTRPWGMQLGS